MTKVKPKIAGITIYPIKSLDGVALKKAQIIEGGTLRHDREYAMSDADGNFIIGKSNARVHNLRSTIDFENEVISFRDNQESTWNKFHLGNDQSEIQDYLSAYFGTSVTLHQNKKGRFMDIPDISGLTILSKASLELVSTWFDNMTLEESRKRFRATIEIDGVQAFWEDHLFSSEGKGIEFRVGEVTLFGMSPRARCVVPTRNPETGEALHAFTKSFVRHRTETLPDFSKLKEYGHHYHLTVNCYVPASENGKWINVGDELEIIGEKLFF